MKSKFWVYYFTLVLLLSGLAYVATSNVSDVPFALSDSEMAVLRATGSDQKCVRQSEPGCDDSKCQEDDPPLGSETFGQKYNDCQWANGWKCKFWGPDDAQILCRILVYSNNCSTYEHTEFDTSADCHSTRMKSKSKK